VLRLPPRRGSAAVAPARSPSRRAGKCDTATG
jgi:hypothetical protein